MPRPPTGARFVVRCFRCVDGFAQTMPAGWPHYCPSDSVLRPRPRFGRDQRQVTLHMLQTNPAQGRVDCQLRLRYRCHRPRAHSRYSSAASECRYTGLWCQCCHVHSLVGAPQAHWLHEAAGQSRPGQSQCSHAGLRRRQNPLALFAGGRSRFPSLTGHEGRRSEGYLFRCRWQCWCWV